MAETKDLAPIDTDYGNTRSQATRMVYELLRHKGQRFGDYILECTVGRKGRLWSLTYVGDA